MFWRYRGIPEVQLSGNLAGKTLFQQVVALAFWPFLQNLMGTVVSFVDMMIASRMTAEDITGYSGDPNVSSAMIEMMGPIIYVIWMMMILQGSIATGAQALVARANGGKDRELAERAFGQSVLLGIFSGMIGGGVIWLLRDQIIELSDITPRAAMFAENYIKIVAFSAPLSGVLFVVNSCLRASGDTLRPFIAMCLVNLVNVIASLIFVHGPAPLGGHGEAGIAGGTVVGWLAGVIVILWVVRVKGKNTSIDDPMVLRWRYLIFEKVLAWRISRVALPNAIEVIGMCSIHSIGFYFVAQVGKKYAEKMGAASEGVIVGAHAVAVRIESFSFMPGFALGMAAATLAGQYLGAESPEMAKRAVRFCWGVALVTMSFAGVVMYIFAEPLVKLLIDTDGEQLEVAVGIIRIFAFAQPLFATTMVMKMSMRGAGDTATVMFSAFVIMITVRILLLGPYTYSEGASINGVWMIMSLDLLVQATVFTILHYRGKWTKAKV